MSKPQPTHAIKGQYHYQCLALIPGTAVGVHCAKPEGSRMDVYTRWSLPSAKLQEIEDWLLDKAWRAGAADLVRYWSPPADVRLVRQSVMHAYSGNPYNGLRLELLHGYSTTLQLSEGEPILDDAWITWIAGQGYHRWTWMQDVTGLTGRTEDRPTMRDGKWWRIARAFPTPSDDGRQIIYRLETGRTEVWGVNWYHSVADADMAHIKREGR